MISHHATAVKTSVGEMRGRNAIYLDEVVQTRHTLKITGELNSDLCSSAPMKGSWLRYSLTFEGVLAFEAYELEVSALTTDSEFDEADDLSWLREASLMKRAKELKYDAGGRRLRTYLLSTYDWVFRIAATHYELNILSERPKKK
jgi:hypothetical protein